MRIAPSGAAWSIWYFTDEDGRFEGHYVNLERVHERPTDGRARVHTRDLTLDLWVADGETWRPPDGWDVPLTLPASIALPS